MCNESTQRNIEKCDEQLQADALLGRILDPLDRELAVVQSPVDGKVFYGERGLVATRGGELAAIAVSEKSSHQ